MWFLSSSSSRISTRFTGRFCKQGIWIAPYVSIKDSKILADGFGGFPVL